MTPSANKVCFPLACGRATPHPASPATSLQGTTLTLLVAQQVIQAMSNQYDLGSFAESDLLVNITQHTLVPKHDVLSPEDKALLLQK
jgi:hypothetical protein